MWFDSDVQGHVNHTAYNPETMRVLKAVDGQLRFVTADIANLPANQSYILLSGTRQCGITEYTVMTDEEFILNAVDGIMAEDAIVDVYTPDGLMLRSGVARSDVSSFLPSGIYILRSGASVEKIRVF